MSRTPSPETWAELRKKRPTYEGALTTVPATSDPSGYEICFAMDWRSDLHLLIPVKNGPEISMPPDLQGLKVRHRHVVGELQYLDVTAASCHERLFSPFCGEVLTAVVDRERRAWEAVAATIRAWQSAWRPVSPGIPKTVQVGLFGELLTLERIVIPALGPAAVHHWSGPDAERHDFVGSKLHLEVKTTRKGRHEHEISRIDQMSVPEGRKLMVVSVLLEESAAGTESIATKMDSITQEIRPDPGASDLFQAKMVQMGWSEELRRSGDLLTFNVRASIVCEVDDGFPRLPDGFEPPSGVVAVKYTIDMANLPALDLGEVTDRVREGF